MITHVSFSGGGIKGLCYLGVLRYLYIEKMIDNIKFVSGSSIGAFFAMVLALKIPLEFIEKEFVEVLKNIHENGSMCIDKRSFIGLLEKNGFHSVRFIIQPVLRYLKEYYDIQDITFMDFVKKTGVNIYINTVNLNTSSRKIFSAEDTPNVSVVEAVVASMTVPVLFEAIKIDGEYYVDGVLSYDMPIDIFENVPKVNVLGVLMLQSEKDTLEVYPKDTELDFMQYMSRIFNVMMINLIHRSTHKYKNRDDFYILKLTDLPYDKSFKFVWKDDGLVIDCKQEEVDNLILKGFIETTKYMNKRYPRTEQTV